MVALRLIHVPRSKRHLHAVVWMASCAPHREHHVALISDVRHVLLVLLTIQLAKVIVAFSKFFLSSLKLVVDIAAITLLPLRLQAVEQVIRDPVLVYLQA